MTGTAAETDGLDLGILRQLEASVGREVLLMLVDEFRQVIGSRLDRLEAAALSRDADVLIRQAHDLSSEAGSLGLTALFNDARALEVAGKTGDLERAAALAQGLRPRAMAPLAALKTLFPPA